MVLIRDIDGMLNGTYAFNLLVFEHHHIVLTHPISTDKIRVLLVLYRTFQYSTSVSHCIAMPSPNIAMELEREPAASPSTADQIIESWWSLKTFASGLCQTVRLPVI